MSESGDLHEEAKRIVRENNVELKELMMAVLSKIAGYLYQEGLIEQTTVNKMGMIGVDRFNLASDLLTACQPSIEQHPEENFPKFISVLRKFVTMKKVAQKMEDEFKKAMTTAPASIGSEHGEVIMPSVPSLGASLEPSDLVDVFDLTGDLREWKILGLRLGLPFQLLEEIEHEKQGVDNCKMAMLHKWLVKGGANRQSLASALRKMGKNELADGVFTGNVAATILPPPDTATHTLTEEPHEPTLQKMLDTLNERKELDVAFTYGEGSNDINDIIRVLGPTCYEFHKLGRGLNLDGSVMELILYEAKRSPPDESLAQVLTKWLTWNYPYEKLGRPSLSLLVKAVYTYDRQLAVKVFDTFTATAGKNP